MSAPREYVCFRFGVALGLTWSLASSSSNFSKRSSAAGSLSALAAAVEAPFSITSSMLPRNDGPARADVAGAPPAAAAAAADRRASPRRASNSASRAATRSDAERAATDGASGDGCSAPVATAVELAGGSVWLVASPRRASNSASRAATRSDAADEGAAASAKLVKCGDAETQPGVPHRANADAGSAHASTRRVRSIALRPTGRGHRASEAFTKTSTGRYRGGFVGMLTVIKRNQACKLYAQQRGSSSLTRNSR